MPRRLTITLCLAILALAAARADAQDKPPPAPPGGSPEGRAPKDSGGGPRIRMGGDPEPAPEAPKPPVEAPTDGKSEPEIWLAELSKWPAADARQASVRLANVPAVAYPMLEKKLLEANQDWRTVAGVAATLGKMRDLRAIELLRAKLDDKRMYQHSTEILEALVRIDPVGAKPRLLSLMLHPASAVVAEVEKLLEPRVAPTDLDSLRDVFDAGGPAARASALRLATKADRAGARPLVVAALRDKEPDVASAAAHSLAADDSPEALDLTLKAMVTPIDRQFAYAVISLAIRAERGGVSFADDALTRALLGGRGLKSLDQLSRASAALLIADLGYYREIPALDEAYDKLVVPMLIDAWVGREFWADLKIVQPLAARRLRRLTGRLDFDTPKAWAAWWEQEGASFVARRVLETVPPELAGTMVVIVDGAGAPGGETTTITSSLEVLGAQSQDEVVLIVNADDAKRLAQVVDESGVLRAPEGSSTARELPSAVGVSVRVGRRERRSTLRTDSSDPGTATFMAAVAELRSRYGWQRYRTARSALDVQSYLLVMSKAFAPERSEDERAASLATLIVEALDDRRGDAWNVRSLKELESMPRLSTALGSAETDRLLAMLGRRPALDTVATGLVRVLAKAKKPETLTHVFDFLDSRGTADARPLLVLVLQNAPRDQYLAALADKRSEVRLAAFEAADRDTLGDDGVARILKAVDDSDRAVAAEAVRALGRLKVEEARPLIDRLAESQSELRVAAVEALGLLGGKDSMSTIMTAYASDDQGVRVAAIQALAATREPEGLSAIVFAMSSDPSGLVREVASRAIVDMGTDRAAAELRKIAVDPAQPPGPRARAVASYSHLRGKAAIPDLVKLVEDPSEEVADEAAIGLARQRDPAAVPHLVSMLEKDRSVQRAKFALESISLESFGQKDPVMLADLYGGWWELSKARNPKLWLLDALTADGGEDVALRSWADGDSGRQVVPSMLKALRHEKWFVRRAADLALRDLLGTKVGDEDPWTTAGEVDRIADAWEKLWAATLGR